VRLCNPLSVIDPAELIATQAPPAAGKTEAEFRTYHMNDAVEQADEGVPMDAWDACRSDIEQPEDAPIVVMVDAGVRNDCSAVVWGCLVNGRAVLRSKVWAPARDGGKDVDLGEVVEFVDELCSTRRVSRLIADPFMLARELQEWARRMGERRVREYRFQWGDIGPDSMTFLKAVQEDAIAHDGDAVHRRHVANMRIKYGPNGAFRFYDHPWKKERPADYPNDAGIASVVVVGELLGQQQPGSGVGARGGLLLV